MTGASIIQRDTGPLQPEHKLVTVIVPVWNNPDQLERCIAALQALSLIHI